MKIKTKEARGHHMKAVYDENHKAIIKWFRAFPDSTKKECIEALGITYKTLRDHLKDIN